MSSVRPLQTLSSVMRTSSPDVVVVTGTDGSFAAAALQRTSSQPSVLYVRVEASSSVALAPHVDLVVTNSGFMAGRIQGARVGGDLLAVGLPDRCLPADADAREGPVREPRTEERCRDRAASRRTSPGHPLRLQPGVADSIQGC